MIAVYHDVDRPSGTTRRDHRDLWHLQYLRNEEEMDRAIDAVAWAMNGAGYRKREIFAMRLAMREAIHNAIAHGHRGDPSLHVMVASEVNDDRALVRVEDEGPGFDVVRFTDPVGAIPPEPHAPRGVILMRSLLSWVRYNEAGNCVTLCKYRMTGHGSEAGRDGVGSAVSHS